MPNVHSSDKLRLEQAKVQLAQAKDQLDRINREPDYELDAHYVESDEQQQRFEELAERQNIALNLLEEEINGLKCIISTLENKLLVPSTPGGPFSVPSTLPSGAPDGAPDGESDADSDDESGNGSDEPPLMRRANGGDGGFSDPVVNPDTNVPKIRLPSALAELLTCGGGDASLVETK